MKIPPNIRRVIVIVLILLSLGGLFVFTVFRAGPLAPVDVTLAPVENQALSPALSGIGTVEARYRFKIGPTRTGRLASLGVDVGDVVKKGQPLGIMDPIDLDARIASQQSTLDALDSLVSMAQSRVQEADAQDGYSASQLRRYAGLAETRAVSEEAHDSAIRNSRAAEASLQSARTAVLAATRDHAAARSTLDALIRQKDELTLVAPVDGLIVERRIEPGSTAVAGEAVLEMIDPTQLWVHLRLNQLDSDGLGADFPARITLRSRPGDPLPGRVLRVEPLADAVTEELLAKVVFDNLPTPLPPLGELVEVDIDLAAEPSTPVIPAAAIHRHEGRLGVWFIDGEKPRFVPVRTGRRSADGMIQVLEGLTAGDGKIIVHSARAVNARSRIRITDSLTP